MTDDAGFPDKSSLLERLRFRGAVSVGERGQVAVPAELRRELDVNPGEKLLVFRVDGEGAALVLTVDGIARLLANANVDELRRVFSGLAGNGGNGSSRESAATEEEARAR